MDSEWCFFFLLFLALNNQISDCFQWTRNQESSRAINTHLGSDVSLPCDFLLTSDEESAMQQFHLIYWTRETPAGSQNWQGMASRTNLINNSERRPLIISPDKSRILMKNNSLTILSVKPEDDALYQCEVKSSFYTTPSIIKLNVLTQKKNIAAKQRSPISNEASAGIGVGATLLVVAAVIILGALFFKSRATRARRRTSQESERSTNLANIQRNMGNSVPEAYVNPVAFHDNEMNANRAANNVYSTCTPAGKAIGDTSF